MPFFDNLGSHGKRGGQAKRGLFVLLSCFVPIVHTDGRKARPQPFKNFPVKRENNTCITTIIMV